MFLQLFLMYIKCMHEKKKINVKIHFMMYNFHFINCFDYVTNFI